MAAFEGNTDSTDDLLRIFLAHFELESDELSRLALFLLAHAFLDRWLIHAAAFHGYVEATKAERAGGPRVKDPARMIDGLIGEYAGRTFGVHLRVETAGLLRSENVSICRKVNKGRVEFLHWQPGRFAVPSYEGLPITTEAGSVRCLSDIDKVIVALQDIRRRRQHNRRHLRPQEHRPKVGEGNMGQLYQRGRIWWVKYYVNGRPVRESTGTEKEKEAERFLKTREGRAAAGMPILPRVDRVRYDEIAEDLRQHYRTTGSRDVVEAEKRLKHLGGFFCGMRVAGIGGAEATTYVEHRQRQEAANGTVNRELAVLTKIA